MANTSDYLELLWVEVIDIRLKNNWIEQCLKEAGTAAGNLFGEVKPALQRLLANSSLRKDLELVCAFVRYETCFGVLAALDDPGLGKAKIAGLQKDFLAWRSGKRKPKTKKEEFFQSLWDSESFIGDDGEWLRNVEEQNVSMEPFGGVFPALKRLLGSEINLKDLGCFFGWNRYQACSASLRLLEQSGFKSGDEPIGLHEMLLTSVPPEGQMNKKSAGQPDPKEPLWKIRPAQALAFSPDSKTLAVAGASGPVRLYDLVTGQEYLSCEGLRVHIDQIVFSPDGKQVVAGQMYKALTICDSKSGKLLHKLKGNENHISGLDFLPNDELVCSYWFNEIKLFDSKTGKSLPSLRVSEVNSMVNAIATFDRGTKIAAHWNGLGGHKQNTITVWSWPERRQLLEFEVGDFYLSDFTVAPDGKTFAVTKETSGGGDIFFFESAAGKSIGHINVKSPRHPVFTPDGSHLVFALADDDQICIWNWRSSTEVRRLDLKDGCYEIRISLDGEYLAAVTFRGSLVWRLPALLK
jgi:hypothetical protein